MKILVLGATGMAGHVIALHLISKNHEVIAYSRKNFRYCENINGDIRDFSHLREIIISGKFDAVVNAVGILNKSAEDEKANAILVNSYLPHFLATITENCKTKVVHISTDCVFSGSKGMYSENSLTDGRSFYDRSKALGEIRTNKDITFRTSIIGPELNENGIGLFNWYTHQKGVISGYCNAIWSGITTLTLANAIEMAIQTDLSGLYHLVSEKPISKYDLLNLFHHYFPIDKLLIEPRNEPMINKSLICTRNDFAFEVPDYDTMLSEMKEWMIDHQSLYPHYSNILKNID